MRNAAVPPMIVPIIVNGSGTAVGVGGGGAIEPRETIEPRGTADAAIGKEIAETTITPAKTLILCKM